jgi:tetratricopeptide (TPR) repeat protein
VRASRGALRARLIPTILLATALVAAPSLAGAQRLQPKRALAASSSPCPRFPTPVAPSPQQREEARRLTQQGSEAALVGDHTEARNLLRRAAELDLTSENVAYRLGREHEEVGAASDAIREYCRFLSLAPQAPDAPDVRERIARLSPQQSLSATDVAAAQFAAGVGLYDRGQFREAQTAFASVIAENPDAAPAYFNRGLANAAQGNPTAAIADLRRYLALQPRAPDRRAVEDQLAVLRRQQLSPGSALGWGAIVPGGGQFYTRRPVLGAAVVAVVAGAAVYAAQSEDRDSTVLRQREPPVPPVPRHGHGSQLPERRRGRRDRGRRDGARRARVLPLRAKRPPRHAAAATEHRAARRARHTPAALGRHAPHAVRSRYHRRRPPPLLAPGGNGRLAADERG